MDSIPPIDDAFQANEDVLAEETIVKQQMTENTHDPNVAVQIRGLSKSYPGTRKMVGSCECQKSSTYHAVKGIWVNIAKDQLFCLLGPNGAGKTTVINCLTGVTPVTGGDGINCLLLLMSCSVGTMKTVKIQADMVLCLTALIYGYSIRSSIGMSNIRRLIGVCPQVSFDDANSYQRFILKAYINCCFCLHCIHSLISYGMLYLDKSTCTSSPVFKDCPQIQLNRWLKNH